MGREDPVEFYINFYFKVYIELFDCLIEQRISTYHMYLASFDTKIIHV